MAAGPARQAGPPFHPHHHKHCEKDSPASNSFGTVMRNITLTGGVTPARAYIEELMPDILEGTIQPGKVFDQTVALDDIAAGYRAMADRTALKVLIRP